MALTSADYILSVSAFTAQKTAELFGIKDTITTIHNGVDVDAFTPDNSKIIPFSILYFVLDNLHILEFQNGIRLFSLRTKF